jgi:hypothetical protein
MLLGTKIIMLLYLLKHWKIFKVQTNKEIFVKFCRMHETSSLISVWFQLYTYKGSRVVMFHWCKPRLNHSLLMLWILHIRVDRNPPTGFGNQTCEHGYTISAVLPNYAQSATDALCNATEPMLLPSFLVVRTVSQRRRAWRVSQSRSFFKACCIRLWTDCEKEANGDGLVFSGAIPMNHQPKLTSWSFTAVTGCKSVGLRSMPSPPWSGY